MQKLKLAFATIFVSAAACFSAFAGTWTNIDPESGYEYDTAIFYLKDDGTYAHEEWIVDNGVSYWIDSYSMRPYYAGIATDGTWYDDEGKRIDFKGKYLDTNDAVKIHKDMTYQQAVNIMGIPHSLEKIESYTLFSGEYNSITAIWFSQDQNSYLRLSFRDNKINSINLNAYFY